MQASKRLTRSIPLLAAALVLAGCMDRGTYLPPPIVLANTAPDQLDVSVAITMGGYDRATQAQTQVHIMFIAQGYRSVRFVADEHLECNNTPVAQVRGIFQDYEAPTADLAGTRITCTYTSGQTSATMVMNIPSAPELLEPADQAQVTRAPALVVRYRLDKDAKEARLVVLGPKDKVFARLTSGVSGEATLNTTSLGAGPGSVALTVEQEVTGAQATGFKSFQARVSATVAHEVTWQ